MGTESRKRKVPILVLGLISLPLPICAQVLKPTYSAIPNHVEIVRRALELADSLGFSETGITHQDVRDRLEAGAYGEDYDPIPGVVGEHFPSPWQQGPEVELPGIFRSTMKVPYGELIDANSGWYRGLAHGYDPRSGYRWPGAQGTTVQWANHASNAFTWDNALRLYHQGKKGEAYECLGHVLHLLMDLSVPAHVKVVNHGTMLVSRRTGYIYDPDLANIIADEFEMALGGGLEVGGVVNVIPDLLGVFRDALRRASPQAAPRRTDWSQYFRELAEFTSRLPTVEKYYTAPNAEGVFGLYRDQFGSVVLPKQMGTVSFAVLVGDRWTQFAAYSTATLSGGTAVPQTVMVGLCDTLVPKAAEYCAGLIMCFRATTTDVGGRQSGPVRFALEQNYPNPSNPNSEISYHLPALTISERQAGLSEFSDVRLSVYDLLGREITVLASGRRAPGVYSVTFVGSGLPSGVYFYRLTAGDLTLSKKLLLVK